MQDFLLSQRQHLDNKKHLLYFFPDGPPLHDYFQHFWVGLCRRQFLFFSPLKATFFAGKNPGNKAPIRGTNSKTTPNLLSYFLAQYLKRHHKSSCCGTFEAEDPRRYKTTCLTPKTFDDHPILLIWEYPPGTTFLL